MSQTPIFHTRWLRICAEPQAQFDIENLRYFKTLATFKSQHSLPTPYPKHYQTTNQYPTNSACQRVLGISELVDTIVTYLDDFHDLSCCLAVNRSLRHAVQRATHASDVLGTFPLTLCDKASPFFDDYGLEKYIRWRTRYSRERPSNHRFLINTGNITFPKNSSQPLILSIYERIDPHPLYRVIVDITYSRHGHHQPQDFEPEGSWVNLRLPVRADALWIVGIKCDCQQTDSFREALEAREVYRDIHDTMIYPYRLITRGNDHLRQIAEYTKKAYRKHYACANDDGMFLSSRRGISAISFELVPEWRENSKVLNHSRPAHNTVSTTSPSVKFKAWYPAEEKISLRAREHILPNHEDAAAGPSHHLASWDDMLTTMIPNRYCHR